VTEPDSPVDGPAGRGHDEERPVPVEGPSAGLDVILEEIDQVAEPVTESVSMAPAVGIAVAGGPMLTLPEDGPAVPPSGGSDSIRSGLTQAGPVAVAGLVVNGAAALVVVAVARLVSSQAYGAIAQLLGLFFILSMPGSAVLVGVVRRITALRNAGHSYLERRWVSRVHRVLLVALAVEVVVVVLLQGWIAKQLSLPNSDGIVPILVAAGIWIVLCVDRGVLQAHRRYGPLAVNLLVEGGVRTILVVVLVVLHLGVAGYAIGIFVSEVVATAHAHWLASRVWADAPSGATARAVATGPVTAADATTADAATDANTADQEATPTVGTVVDPGADTALVRRKLMADVSAAFVGLALLGLLQNVDVIVLGRLDHHNVGPYAAISVASKALVFGALALGAYLLPEATIRWNEGGHAVRQLGVTLIFLAVPAALLLFIAVFVPRQFLTLVFSAKLSAGAPAFASLVGAMIFLSLSVLITNYLFGTGSRWIVFLLAGGSLLALGLIWHANGQIVATARADLVAQGALAIGMLIAFLAIHHRHGRHHWPMPRSRRDVGRSAPPEPRPPEPRPPDPR
jgi:O-antigen/teichoic acid export membrane protein